MKKISRVLVLALSMCMVMGMFCNVNMTFGHEHQKYTYSDLEKMTIFKLSELYEFEVQGFQTPSDEAIKFYSDSYRMLHILEELKYDAENFHFNDSQRISRLFAYVNQAIKWSEKYPELKYMKEPFIRDELNKIYQIFYSNHYFDFGKSDQNEVMYAFFQHYFLMDRTPEELNAMAPFVKKYRERRNEFMEDKYLMGTYSSFIYFMEKYFDEQVLSKINNPSESKYYKTIDPLVNELYELIAQNIMSSDLEAELFQGILYRMDNLALLHSDSKLAHRAYSALFKRAPVTSRNKYFAADKLNRFYNGEDIDGKNIQFETVVQNGKKNYLPKTYVFDNGMLIIRAGERIEESKIFSFYWASKEVRAQFFNAFETDKPVVSSDAKRPLNVYIYDSESDYKLNSVFNNRSTHNGGFYGYQEGAIYCYNLSDKQDDYTSHEALDFLEIFRHEYAHHLQFNYAVPMEHPKSKIYGDERLTWFIEGGADYFQGATRTDGIVQLEKEAQYLEETKDTWYDAAKTLTVKYNNYVLYKYSNFLMDMLYTKNPNEFKTMKNLIRTGDVKGYTTWVNNMSKSKSFNDDYQKYMAFLKQNSHKLQKLSYNQDYLKKHEVYAFSKIVKDIQSIQPLKNPKVKTYSSKYFNTFELRGELANQTGNIYENINNMLKTLDQKSWSGYKTFTAYVVPKGKGYEMVIHGILTCPVNEAINYKF